jgi:hypothetical protein
VEWARLGGGEAKGRTERLRLQRDTLLKALPMALTEDSMIEALREVLGPGPMEALAEVNLDGVQFEGQHALVVCTQIEKACYEFRGLQNARAEQAEEVLRNTPAPKRPAPWGDATTCENVLRQAESAYHRAEAVATGFKANLGRRDALRIKVEAEEKEIPAIEAITRTVRTYTDEHGRLEKEIAGLEEELRRKRSELGEVRTKKEKAETLMRRQETLEANRRDLAELESALKNEGQDVDLAGLEKRFSEARADLEARRLQDVHDVAAATARDKRAQAEVFTGLVEFFRDVLPKRLIAEARLPVEGLGVDDDQILIGGIPLHQLGTSQQIRVGVLIAAALNPNSGFVLVDGAESIGRDDRLALADAAKELELQLIMTFVDPDAEPGPGVTVMKGGAAVAAKV